MELYDSGLFSELGELMAHDQVFYEDIPKQQDFYPSSPVEDAQQLHQSALGQSPLGGGDELDSLLEEGNEMLDRFMAENGLDLLSTPVDLADVDELINTTYTQLKPTTLAGSISLINTDPFNSYTEQVASPTSSISTLPSEPSSPVDLFPSAAPVQRQTSEPLTDLLESLLSETEVDYSHYDYEVASPASSYNSSSDMNSSYEDNTIYVYQNQWEDNSSTYTQSIYSPAPSLSPVPSAAPEKSGKATKPTKKSKSTPYSKLPAGRKARKKQQNKEAAIRYREKKRSEAVQSQSEEQQLADRNKQLKTEVLNLEREIMCMKELLSDVFNIHSM